MKMPPNSNRYDTRLDKFERHRSCKQQHITKSDLQIKKNCKFRNSVQSNEIKNNKYSIQSKDLKICENSEIDLKSDCKFRILFSKFGSKKIEFDQFIFQCKFEFYKFLNSTIDSIVFSLIKKFANTCSSSIALLKPVLSNLISSKLFSNFTCYAFVTLVCILIYLPCIQNGFVFDDMPAILHNKIVLQPTPFTNFVQLFTTDYWGSKISKEQSHKSFRPFTVFTFRLNYYFGGLDPFGFQLINIILHCLVSILNYRFLGYFLGNESSIIAALLFAIHPIHVDAVASIVGRAELLSALFILIVLNLRLTIKRPMNGKISLMLLFILTLFALLSKEQGITILPLMIMYETFYQITNDKKNEIKCNDKLKDKSSLNKKFKYFLSSQFINYFNLIKKMLNSTYNCKLFTMFICILFFRCRLLHNDLPKFSRFDNPIESTFTWPFKQINYLYIWLFNLYKFLNPSKLACDWSAQSIQLITSASNYITFLMIVTSILIYIIHQTVRSNNFKLLWFISFTIITFLPASNLFVTVGFLFAERILYLPSIGLCAIIAYSYQNLLNLIKIKHNEQTKGKHLKILIRLAMIIICLSFAYRTFLRTFDWKSEYTLYKKDLESNPKNVKLLNNLGKLYEQENNYDKAFDYYSKAIQIQPDDSRGALNSANLHSKLGNYQKAEQFYRQAIKTMPVLINLNEDKGLSFSTKFRNYKNFNQNSGLENQNFEFNQINLNNDEHLTKSMFNKNVINLKQANTLEHFVSTMQLRAALNLANLLSNNPLKTFEANRLYEQLIHLKPDHGATYLSWIESILKSNSSDLRTIKHVLVQLLHNAKYLDVNILYNVAVLISNSGNSMMALQLFDQILKLDPKHEEALLTSARIIRKNSEFNQLQEIAIERLEKFVSLNQLDHNVFFELGMLYINFNIQKSIEYLQKAIEIKPDFSQALFNLSLLLYKQQRAQEAIPFLELLLKQDESHQKAMILLFAINSSK